MYNRREQPIIHNNRDRRCAELLLQPLVQGLWVGVLSVDLVVGNFVLDSA